jgi:hypothetical protein
MTFDRPFHSRHTAPTRSSARSPPLLSLTQIIYLLKAASSLLGQRTLQRMRHSHSFSSFLASSLSLSLFSILLFLLLLPSFSLSLSRPSSAVLFHSSLTSSSPFPSTTRHHISSPLSLSLAVCDPMPFLVSMTTRANMHRLTEERPVSADRRQSILSASVTRKPVPTIFARSIAMATELARVIRSVV